MLDPQCESGLIEHVVAVAPARTATPKAKTARVRVRVPTLYQLTTLLAERGPLTLDDMVALTGRKRATLKTAMATCISIGLAIVTERRPTGGHGRPEAVYGVAA